MKLRNLSNDELWLYGIHVIRESDFTFRDRVLRCNDWSLDVRSSGRTD